MQTARHRLFLRLIAIPKRLGVLLAGLILCSANQIAHADIQAGDRLQTLSNLHPDFYKAQLYTLNYQLPDLIPVCADIEVLSVRRNRMVFLWDSEEFTISYEKHTKKAGVSFQQSLADYFGPHCDAKKLKSLSKVDKLGIEAGLPRIGMSKAGILFAMGRPPHHKTPNLKSRRWMYWLNRFKRKAIEFDENGIVSRVKL